MRSARTLLLIAVIASTAASQELIIFLDSGTYVLDGTMSPPTLERVAGAAAKVVDARTGTTPDPTPSPKTLEEKARMWATETEDPTGARLVSEVYRLTKEQVEKGTLKPPAKITDPNEITNRIKQGTDLVLDTLGTTARWSTARQNLSRELNDRLADGRLRTAEDWVQSLGEIQRGVNYGRADMIDWELIFRIIQLLIELFSSFS